MCAYTEKQTSITYGLANKIYCIIMTTRRTKKCSKTKKHINITLKKYMAGSGSKRKQKKTNKHRRRRKRTATKRNKTKTFRPLRCSPKPVENKYSCFSNNNIILLKMKWNKQNPYNQINTIQPKEIWNELKNKNKNVCSTEACWISQSVKNPEFQQELMNDFAPQAPESWKTNPDEWLSNFDILDVIEQYKRAYPKFEFFGPAPIDFDAKLGLDKCVWDDLCNFDLQKLLNSGKTKIGIIFNTDTHDLGGKHWISLYIDTNSQLIYFFDSVGTAIPKEVKKLVDRITKQGKTLPEKPINFKFDQNHPVEHQYGNSLCGIYSIFFITHMLEGKINAHYLKTHIIKDKYMQSFRKIFYNYSMK